ncbi:MAG: hypothetical protein LBM20_00970 [Rikenellaceae bacterium]|nr:hypothetical protein [Rikenellaceae bacterium]
MKKYTLILLATCALFFSCSREDDVPQPNPNGAERTLLIYMAAQNSLGYGSNEFDYQNILSLLKGVKPGHLQANNILIYHDPYTASNDRGDTNPLLLQVVPGENGSATTKVLKQYNEQNSASGEVLSAVIAEVFDNPKFKAQKYSFLMWSHGTGWLPANPSYSARSRAIGQDGTDWMNITEFAEAIPDGLFDYIAMDACYMGAVEFAYEMQGKADYLIASPTEILASGMPYEVIPEYLLGTTPKYNDFLDAFYRFYDRSGYGSTLSLIRPGQIGTLADVVREVLKNTPMETITAIPDGSLQHFDRTNSTHPYRVFFDLGSFMQQIASPVQLAEFEAVMTQVVPYFRHSESFLPDDDGFTIRAYSGLSTYVPRSTTKLGQVTAYYETLGWYKAVYP